ncbi:sensor histidine kinase [Streptomyces filamentosus]|uniref:sensor histidine kinase n=1 Tax=Streptomyces filamentosus TaxID=67294 RepID=UPI0037F89CF6
MVETGSPSEHAGIGLLEAFVGRGFAAALQDGLRRSAPAYAHGVAHAAADRTAPRTRGAVPAPRRADDGPADGVLRPTEAVAVLRRFDERLHAVLGLVPSPDSEDDAVRAVLNVYARRVLEDAQTIATGAAPRIVPHGPAVPALAPALASAAGALLTECALRHVLASTPAAHAVSRATALVKPLSQAIREHHAAASPALPSAPDGRAGDPLAAEGALWHERRRLARELHDELGTRLTEALRLLELCAQRTEDRHGHLDAAAASLRAAVGQAGDLITGLRNDTALPTLRQAVEELAGRAAPDAAPPVTVVCTGDERLMPTAWRRELLLAVRECLRNALAHAEADRITVTSRVTRRWCHVRVKDDGIGFLPDLDGLGTRGHGLRSVKDRVEHIGGRLSIESVVGEGTTVDIHVPLRPRP